MKFSLGLVLSCVVVVGVAVTSTAGGRKVLVLPVDGDADAATKAKLDGVVQKLAHTIDGNVKVGATTFADDAVSVGCDPSLASCATTVISMLAVDELVWGTANTTDGQVTLTIKRATKGTPAKEQATTVAVTDPPEKAEEGLRPLFGATATPEGSGSAAVGSGSAAGSGSGSAEPPPPPWSRDRKLGVGLSAGGGLALVIGFALWASESGYQDDIKKAPTSTLKQIQDLKALEDKAGSYATWGDIMVVVGLAAGGAGAYYLWKDHNAAVTVAPAPVDNGTGMTLVVGGRW
jgi:hypothetical protein